MFLVELFCYYKTDIWSFIVVFSFKGKQVNNYSVICGAVRAFSGQELTEPLVPVPHFTSVGFSPFSKQSTHVTEIKAVNQTLVYNLVSFVQSSADAQIAAILE